MSLKSKIYEYVKSQYPQIVHKGVIGAKAVMEWGYENENAGRRCRELEEDGKIEVYYQNGQAGYKWISCLDLSSRQMKNVMLKSVKEANEDQRKIMEYRTPKEVITDDLDEQLKTILDGMTVSWGNQDKLKEVQKALRGSSEYDKRAVINKYRMKI
jgi:hypothetical protein